HSFSQSIKPSYASTNYKPYVARSGNSSLYADESTACSSGFAQMKTHVAAWATATASYSNGVCNLSSGGNNIGRLPLLYTTRPTVTSPVLVAFDATREDGQLVS